MSRQDMQTSSPSFFTLLLLKILKYSTPHRSGESAPTAHYHVVGRERVINQGDRNGTQVHLNNNNYCYHRKRMSVK